jgi:hypothetical protein
VLGFREEGVIIASGSHSLRVEFVNARTISPVGGATSSGPAEVQGRAPALGKVTYRDLWDGVTAVYEKTESGVVKSTYHVQALGAKASFPVGNIRLRYNVPVRIDKSGNLVMTLMTGEMRETRPVAWQEVAGKKIAVEAVYRILGVREVGFAVGAYDPRYPLVIDPVLTWNTFLGGSGFDNGLGIAVDTSGNVYVTGYSDGTWGSPVSAFTGDMDAFVAKLDGSGALQWNTFLGGTNTDRGYGIVVNTSGDVYVTGDSEATWGSPVRAFTAGNDDAFVAKLDGSGALQWNTFLGVSGFDYGYGIAVGTSGDVYVTGYSDATWGSPVRAFTVGDMDAFVAKLDGTGNLLWNTFLGGIGEDSSAGIAVDTNGNAYVTGYSIATWGSPFRAFVGSYDTFVAKLDGSGNLQWNTFLGGTSNGCGIAVDTSGSICVAGYSEATWGSPVRAFTGGGADAFVAKLGVNGVLQWNTFLGGTDFDVCLGIAVDTSGNIYVTGTSGAVWGPSVGPFAGGFDAFVSRLDTSGNLMWNTFQGGIGAEQGQGIAVDTSGNSYVTGYCDAAWGSPVRAYSGDYDVYVAKIGNGIRVDFNRDGQEDILWRYYGTGGYNRAWFLGNSELAGLPLAGASPQMAVVSAVQLSGDKARGKTIGDERAMGMITNRPKKSPLKSGQDVVGSMNRRGAGVGVVDDPRKAGGIYPKPSPTSVADPRYVNLVVTPETSSDHLATVASTPTFLGGADVMPVGDLNWQIVGTGDFNNDTYVDILWRNGGTGSNVVWYMNGTQWIGSAELLTVSDLSWKIVGTGDFNRDTHVDILWRNSVSGSNVVWYMDGTHWIGSAVLLGVSDLTWQIVGTGDFNKDGNVDLLWRYYGAGGYNVVWYLNNATWIGSAELIAVGDLNWDIAGTGYYNNDGNIDILWRYNAVGLYTYIWYMDGTTWIGGGNLPPVVDPAWKIVSR